MTAIILGWNPDRWNRWNYPAAVERVAATGLHLERWSVGRHRNIAAGTDVWLLLQGDRGRGLIGHGVVLSAHPEPGPHAPGPHAPGSHVPGPHSVDPRGATTDQTDMYVQVAFDSLLPPGEQIAVDVLMDA
ncbi:MAG TPA: HNH endonuclease, partial [Arthrobacter sp.]|nr:HNH endonuclease [Arthrobacter sp.]